MLSTGWEPSWWQRARYRVLDLLAPTRGVVARHVDRLDADPDYREAAALGLRIRGYRPTGDPDASPWYAAPLTSADGAIWGQREKWVARSRLAVEQHPLAHGVVRTTMPANVVGVGIVAESATEDPDADSRIEAVWAEIRNGLFPAEGIGFAAAQRLLYTKLLEDGEVFVKRSKLSQDEGLFFEVVETDRVGTPPGAAPRDPSGAIRDGVERDASGRVVAYYVLRAHPGDWVMGPGAGPRARPVTRSPEDYHRVPVDQIRHLRIADRPGQSRSVPYLAPVLQDLRDLDLLILALLKRTQVAACLAVFLESAEAAPSILNTTAQTYGYQLDQQIVPGMIFKTSPGEKATTLAPNLQLTDIDAFIVLLARRIAAPLGISWQVLLRDFSQSTYSSARTDLLETRITYRMHQALVVEVLDWIRAEALTDAWLRGDTRLMDLTEAHLRAVTWIPPGWQWIDPQAEAAGAQIELDIGLTTLRDLAASRGKDWQDLMRQRAAEKKLANELGLTPEEAAEAAQPKAEPARAAQRRAA